MNKKYAFVIAGLFIFLAASALFTPTKTVLSISSRKNPVKRIYSALAVQSGFVISYTHSVNKGRVHDYYVCDLENRELVLLSTHFVSYGAGIPEPEEIPGAEFTALDDDYTISNINRKMPKLVMAVGVIADHTFAVNKPGQSDEKLLSNYFEPQTSLIFEIKKVSPVDYWAHKLGEPNGRV